MANSYFEFKQFTIFHDLTAMKVGTDGVLLGAWAEHNSPQTILDVGTGSGLIAIMLAQRYKDAKIWGIDIDGDACKQANINAEHSPWSQNIRIVQADILSFESLKHIDLIVCNPPFYENGLHSPNAKRTMARCTQILPFEQLINAVAKILSPHGHFCVIVPFTSTQNFIHLCWENDLNLLRSTEVSTKEGKGPKRNLLAFTKTKENEAVFDRLVLTDNDNRPTEDYKELTRDYYLEQFARK